MQLSPHFQLKEFLHPGSFSAVTPAILENLRQLALRLEDVRSQCHHQPIRITSGFRTKAHNTLVGGSPNSQHLLGKAADIVVQGMTPHDVQRLLNAWDGGLGCYKTFTHVDIGPKRRWVM